MSSPAPWERQPDETDAAWRAFVVYRDLGPDRTLLEAYKQRYGKETATSPAGHVTAWATAHRWVDRTRSYDAYIERQARAEHEEIWLTRARVHAEDTWRRAQDLHERAQEMLAWPLSRTTYSEDGKTITIEPTKWSMGDAVRMIKIADELERLSLGQPTEHSAVTLSGGFSVQSVLAHLDFGKLSVEELSALRGLLEKAKRDVGELPKAPAANGRQNTARAKSARVPELCGSGVF